MSFEFLVLSGQWSEMYRSRNICNSRIEVADALRGVAVMGIILLHAIDHFNVFTAEPITYSLPCDTFVEKAATWLLRDKMYGLFALLFGLSFFIMNDDQQQKGHSCLKRKKLTQNRMCVICVSNVCNMRVV